jgi:hypothetical protein
MVVMVVVLLVRMHPRANTVVATEYIIIVPGAVLCHLYHDEPS